MTNILFWDTLLILYISLVGAVCAVILCATVWAFVKAGKSRILKMIAKTLISLLLVAVVTVSWLLNMGFFRILLTFFLVPLVHAGIFLVTNLFMVPFIENNKKTKKENFLFCLCYVLLYAFLPDGGNYGEMRFFFGLIESDILSNPALGLAMLALAGHIAMFSKHMDDVLAAKRNKKNASSPPPTK